LFNSDFNPPKKLSILVPSYNVEKYVIECLESIETQLTNECEVIVYDDASTDNTVDTIKNSSIYKTPNFSLVLGPQNKGLSFARNTLRTMASGEYLWFFDSDDKILDGAIDKILSIIHTSNVDIILFNFNFWYEDPAEQILCTQTEQRPYVGVSGEHRTNHVSAFSACLRSNNLHAHSKVYHRDIFREETDFPVGQIFEDISVVPLLMSLSKSVCYIDEPLYAYRQRPGSIISNMKAADEVKPLKAILDLKTRYEEVHGQINEEALSALMVFTMHQFRTAVRKIAKKAPADQKPRLLKEALEIFQSIHGRNYFYVMKTCYKEKGLIYCFHISKRLLKAKIVAARSSQS